jgi:predicted CopG family antitoxin
MRKKLTITIDERIYNGLYRVAGRRRISGLIESLVRSHLDQGHLDTAYRQMAQEEAREAEALEWADAVLGDIADEKR